MSETTNETRKYLPPVHTSAETAFVQDGYPFGYRGKCLRRCWIETKPKHGQRFVYQTSAPYYPEQGEKGVIENGRAGAVPTSGTGFRGLKWNAPKASTYSEVVVLYLDSNDHIHTDGVSVHATAEQFAAFRERAKDGLDGAGLKRIETAEKVTAAIAALWAKRQAEVAAQPHMTAAQRVDAEIAKLNG